MQKNLTKDNHHFPWAYLYISKHKCGHSRYGSERSPGEGQATESSILGLPLWLNWYRIRLQCRRPGFGPWVGKIPWRRERLPTPVFLPGEFHGLYSPRGHKESDITKQLSLHFTQMQCLISYFTYFIMNGFLVIKFSPSCFVI